MRLLIKRPLTGLWLDLEAPFTGKPRITRGLNGAGAIDVTFSYEYWRRQGEDGHPILMEYGTLLVAEDDGGRLLQSALVDDITLTAEGVSVSAGGLSMMATGCPWRGPHKKYLSADPVSIFKDVWGHILAPASARVGLSITGDTRSSGRLGVPASALYTQREATRKAAENSLKLAEAALARTVKTRGEHLRKTYSLAGLPFTGITAKRSSPPTTNVTKTLWIDGAVVRVYNRKTKAWDIKAAASSAYHVYLASLTAEQTAKSALKAAKAKATASRTALKDISDQAAAPYEINWWTTQDLGPIIQDLAAAGPFEFREVTTWDGTQIRQALEVGAPSVGARRGDLRFEIGVNIIEQPALAVVDVVTELVVYGSGEGSAMIHGSATVPAAPRVRRVRVDADKDARTAAQAATKLRTFQTQAKAARSPYSLDSLKIVDHSFARFSQFDVGDEIRVTGTAVDGTDLDLWVRILETATTEDDSIMDLKVETL